MVVSEGVAFGAIVTAKATMTMAVMEQLGPHAGFKRKFVDLLMMEGRLVWLLGWWF